MSPLKKKKVKGEGQIREEGNSGQGFGFEKEIGSLCVYFYHVIWKLLRTGPPEHIILNHTRTSQQKNQQLSH